MDLTPILPVYQEVIINNVVPILRPDIPRRQHAAAEFAQMALRPVLVTLVVQPLLLLPMVAGLLHGVLVYQLTGLVARAHKPEPALILPLPMVVCSVYLVMG